jgi:DNA-binding GntR family transcriptional regulator
MAVPSLQIVDGSVYTFARRRYHARMDASPTRTIVEALTRAIVEHRLQPGTKLAEQKLADHFGVSRTLVRQALFQLVQKHLVRMEPARGAFVAVPTVEEARQVFQVRRVLEAEMVREFLRQVTPARIRALREHLAQEKAAVEGRDAGERSQLLGDFHVRMAELTDNTVLTQIVRDLVSRSSLITLLYQREAAAAHSQEEHVELVKALAARDEKRAVKLMQEHLLHVEESLAFDRPVPSHDIALALA